MYAYGQYVKQNFIRSQELFNQACDYGHNESCNFSGLLLKNGISGKADLEKASVYFEKACKLGSKDGCKNLQSLGSKVAMDE